MRADKAPLVVICEDHEDAPPVQFRLTDLAERVKRAVPGTAVIIVPRVCQAPTCLVEALSDVARARVVLGCKNASTRRSELMASLRKARFARGGIEIVDLATTGADGEPPPRPEIVFEQAAAVLHAAVVRVAACDIETATKERRKFISGTMSRRSLFAANALERQPVAAFVPANCGRAACSACVLACPQGALWRDGGRIAISAELCNGCGACVTACRSGAFVLPGAGLLGLEAAAGVLVRALGRKTSANGIAISCEDSSGAPRLGGRWLVLKVPSLEMVTAGWLLRLIAAGVGACVVACQQAACQKRASDLDSYLGVVAAQLGFSSVGSGHARHRASATSGDLDPVLGLLEPEATTESLSTLGIRRQLLGPLQAGGPGCSSGEVEVDIGACCLCGVCAGACPTGALAAELDHAGSLVLSFDPTRCTACGSCVASCPETAVQMQRRLERDLSTTRRVLTTSPSVICEGCGASLCGAMSNGALARLGATHPLLAAEAGRICADCRLLGRSDAGRRVM